MNQSITRKQAINAAKREIVETRRALDVHSKVWLEEFQSASNPFVAIETHLSAEQRARRAKLIQPWLDACAQLEAIMGAKKPDLAPARGSSFMAPITTPAQADRTNSIARRL